MPPLIRWILLAFILVAFSSTLCVLLRYRITERHLEVRFLGLCVRRIALSDIRRVSKHREGWAEHWWNTLWPKKRRLVIHRRTGWFQCFIITPVQRYAFKAELEQAMKRERASRGQMAEITAPAEAEPAIEETED